MATKTANLYVRIEPDIKEQAEKILDMLGISASNAVNILYKQIILQKGLPFEVKLPVNLPLDINTLTAEAFDQELEKGYQDVLNGRTRSVSVVFQEFREEGKL